MMRFMCAMALVLAACGGPERDGEDDENTGGQAVDFSGAYGGTMVRSGPCSDGSRADESFQVRLVLAQTGTELAVGSKTCPGLKAKVNGNGATLQPITCTPRQENGHTFISQFTGGTLALNGTVLSVTFRQELTISGPSVNGKCTVTDSADLVME